MREISHKEGIYYAGGSNESHYPDPISEGLQQNSDSPDERIHEDLQKLFGVECSYSTTRDCSLSTNVSDPDGWRKVEIRTTRNIPRNVLEEAQTAAQLKGMYTKELRERCKCLKQDLKELAAEKEKAYLRGMVDGLRYAVKCNGISGAEVK